MIRDFFYSLMTDKNNEPIYTPAKFVLYAASLIYGLAIGIRSCLYKVGIFKSEKAPLKVISIGNLTLGGTGKTPFTIALSNILKEEFKREAAVLIRGYGWDEQAMLKKSLPDTPVLVGKDRLHSAERAVKLYGTAAAILDDGFQHWELARDLDIVLVDSGNPFGNGCLFPRGVLREPLSALKRAEVVVLTKIDKNGNAEIDNLKLEISKIHSKAEILEAVHHPTHFYDHRQHKDFKLDIVKNKRVLLVSGIGDPSYFERTISSLDAEIVGHMAYPDHHEYREKDRAMIMKRALELKTDFIITTDKDSVKFTRMGFSFGTFQVLTLMIEITITNGKELLIARLHSILRG